MTKYLKNKWIKALRSGDFKQTTGSLKTLDEYCCLGVLCEISSKLPFSDDGYVFPDTIDQAAGSIPRYGLERIGLTIEAQDILIGRNDGGSTFEDIAIWIKQNI